MLCLAPGLRHGAEVSPRSGAAGGLSSTVQLVTGVQGATARGTHVDQRLGDGYRQSCGSGGEGIGREVWIGTGQEKGLWWQRKLLAFREGGWLDREKWVEEEKAQKSP